MIADIFYAYLGVFEDRLELGHVVFQAVRDTNVAFHHTKHEIIAYRLENALNIDASRSGKDSWFLDNVPETRIAVRDDSV